MFSEYASRFLAQSQSQSRPSAGQQQNNRSPSRNNNNQSNSRFGGRGVFRSNMLGPYNQTSRFPFSSRTQATQAPLFASTADEFREEEDGEEHQRDVADFYALQSSRKAFRASHLTDSSEADDYVDNSSPADEAVDSHDSENESPFRRPRGQGIRSSWHGLRPNSKDRQPKPSTMASVIEERRIASPLSRTSNQNQSQKGKEKLVSVDLSNSEHSSIDNIDQEADYGPQDSTPAYSGFHFKSQKLKQSEAEDVDEEPPADDETSRLYQRPRSPIGDGELPVVGEEEEQTVVESPKHDVFWGTLFMIAFASLFASAFLVYLHTDKPGGKNPLGDTIYTILRQKYYLLAVDTLIAIIVAAVWLALLRTYLRPLTYLTILAVPVILFSFTLWPFITSFKKHNSPLNTQYTVMRIFSFVPFFGAIIWTYIAIQSRHSIERSIQILELASKILSASPALVMAGGAALGATVVWFWLWLSMFTRVFLEGHMARKLFIIDTSAWYLGVFFFLMLLWTQLVIAGIQRATTAATVSQWYFYRSSDNAVTSREVVTASFNHATGPLFGTICLSTLTSLLIRVPILVLPRRFIGMCSLFLYALIPAPLRALTTPLTLTYAAIHSQPLTIAARGVSRLPLSATSNTNTHTHHHNHQQQFSQINRGTDPLTAYNTTHMLLHATRQIMSLALGLGAWLSTSNASAYGYIVGLGAAAVGWGVLGAVEGIVGGVVDGVLVCWGSEVAAGRPGRFCPEAKMLFGEGGRRGESVGGGGGGGRIMV